MGSHCYLVKLHVASRYPTRNDPVLKHRVTVCPISWVYCVRYSQTVVLCRMWQGWVVVLPLNRLFAPTSQRKCNMSSCPAQWKHSFLITCPSHYLLRILDALVMSWLDLGILTNRKLSVTPTPLHRQSMRRKFLSLWKWLWIRSFTLKLPILRLANFSVPVSNTQTALTNCSRVSLWVAQHPKMMYVWDWKAWDSTNS